jgi:hypothetical protein
MNDFHILFSNHYILTVLEIIFHTEKIQGRTSLNQKTKKFIYIVHILIYKKKLTKKKEKDRVLFYVEYKWPK